jgi:hypothetical protein
MPMPTFAPVDIGGKVDGEVVTVSDEVLVDVGIVDDEPGLGEVPDA